MEQRSVPITSPVTDPTPAVYRTGVVSDAADAGSSDALVASASLVEGRDGADEDAANAGAGAGIVGAEEPDAVREGEHPDAA
jgi:hypothetical protein